MYQVLIESSNMTLIRIDVGIIQEKSTINTQFNYLIRNIHQYKQKGRHQNAIQLIG